MELRFGLRIMVQGLDLSFYFFFFFFYIYNYWYGQLLLLGLFYHCLCTKSSTKSKTWEMTTILWTCLDRSCSFFHNISRAGRTRALAKQPKPWIPRRWWRLCGLGILRMILLSWQVICLHYSYHFILIYIISYEINRLSLRRSPPRLWTVNWLNHSGRSAFQQCCYRRSAPLPSSVSAPVTKMMRSARSAQQAKSRPASWVVEAGLASLYSCASVVTILIGTARMLPPYRWE